jgi:hypothetical protein
LTEVNAAPVEPVSSVTAMVCPLVPPTFIDRFPGELPALKPIDTELDPE